MSIIKHVTLQKIVAHDFRYESRMCVLILALGPVSMDLALLLQFIEVLGIKEGITCANLVLIGFFFHFRFTEQYKMGKIQVRPLRADNLKY